MMEKWIAVYTKSRHEKVVIQELEKKNIEPIARYLKKDGSGAIENGGWNSRYFAVMCL